MRRGLGRAELGDWMELSEEELRGGVGEASLADGV